MFGKFTNYLTLSQNRYVLLISIFLTGLMFSKFLLSISLFLLVGNWLLEGNLKKKIQKLYYNKAAMAFLMIFGLHIAGLFYTFDFNYALKDIRIKLPLFILPVVFGSISPFSQKQFKQVFHFFILIVIISSIVSLFIYFQNPHLAHRNISPFMHHIRLSLITTIACFFVFYQALYSDNKRRIYRIFYLLIGFYLFIFTFFFIGSINGILIFTCTLFWWLAYILYKNNSLRLRIISSISLLGIICLVVVSFVQFKKNYFPERQPLSYPFEEFTAQGNSYFHGLEANVYENGYPIHVYVCEKELEKAWNNKNVDVDFYKSYDNKYQLKDVLIRYMTSKGLKKDSVGFSELSNTDMQHIINGITHYRLAGKKPIVSRLYELYWGYYNQYRNNKSTDNSFLLRMQYWEVSMMIIWQAPIFGIGTGDVRNAFEEQYIKIHTSLDLHNQRRSHNQYLAITIAFGLFGLCVFLFALIYPAIINKKYNSFHFITVFIILSLSMMTEDTMETQIGVSIFGFFYCFFLFKE